jgi:hypothetical protein
VVDFVSPNGMANTPQNADQVCGDPDHNILLNGNNA